MGVDKGVGEEELLIVDHSPIPNPQSPPNSKIEAIAPESMQHSEVS
ncbi:MULTISPECIES: hypothetical protein [Nostoc]|uniref:Uncharacterized protein n=2 Tax=Nostoc TaxID=1177 RepID=A0ABR8IDD9_9NOSO|nr:MULTISPECIES: hypothetical protein [Nostoc]MBD2563252.1 hypothetical protein [Nostoc linckia FACHB-391]MBD2648919.1 hypothetical protein [Nostoc foliaceum FACHB-393]